MEKTRNMIYKASDEARELYLYATNNGVLWERYFVPILKNLQKHAAKGRYDSDKAVIALYHFMTYASNQYGREFGYTFTVTARFTAAVDFEKDVCEEYLNA